MANPQTIGRILALSALEGTRVMTPPALLSLYFARRPNAAPRWLTKRVGTNPAVWTLAALALGEIVVDKLPTTPSRTVPIQLIARIVFGSALGTLLARVYEQPIWIGTVGGAGAATASTYAVSYVRRELGRVLHLPDLVLALVEDGTVITLGWQLLTALDQTSDA